MNHDIIFYRTPAGDRKIEVVYQEENFWLSQKLLADLFGIERSVVTKHLRNIFDDNELEEPSVCAKFAHTAADGKNYQTKFYNLDAIIAVGYRVNSYEATQFRIWATKTLKEFIIEGFVLDDERLKQGRHFGKDYFDELLERIREIRASERRFYQKIADIYALSADYDKDAPVTKDFFASVQNKLHWAITGKTAAEIIHEVADANKPHMGLTHWKQAPDGKVLKSDISVAKNYLNKTHIQELNRIVSAYLDLAENRAERQVLMKMVDWMKFLHSFLELSDYPILQDKGKTNALEARLKAEQEYKTFRQIQDREYISDFDREIKRIQGEQKESRDE
ncbi:MAG: virulence RhuM family protein [Planctomycetaceae bacterium]|nr:virulence RhuM family protein [Planctomycetaceae bacterium]